MKRPLCALLSLIFAACGPTPGDSTTEASTQTSTSSTSSTSTYEGTSQEATTDETAATTDDATTDDSTATTDETTEGPIDCGEDIEPANSCPGAIELLLADTCEHLAGIEACPGGSAHRHTAVDCHVAPMYNMCMQQQSQCTQDSECTDWPTGICGEEFSYCYCRYPCTSDSECGPDAACACETQFEVIFEESPYGGFYNPSTCVSANCKTDEDCPGSYSCGASPGICGGLEGFYCHGPDDECEGNSDCLADELDRCAFDEDVGHWVCDSFAICE